MVELEDNKAEEVEGFAPPARTLDLETTLVATEEPLRSSANHLTHSSYDGEQRECVLFEVVPLVVEAVLFLGPGIWNTETCISAVFNFYSS